MQLLDHGELNLISSMGDDRSVVRAARVSNGIVEEVGDDEKDAKLIKYLIKHRHGTPFEHTSFTFYVKTPLFVRSEWFRHRIGSFNEISGRYVKFEPEFYVPKDYRIPASTNKQGSVPATEKPLEWHEFARGIVGDAVAHSYAAYESLLAQGVAREMARMVLPQNLYTQFYWTVNARALMNFVSLRTAEDAQWEIRQYANAIENAWMFIMPLTWEAFVINGRISP